MKNIFTLLFSATLSLSSFANTEFKTKVISIREVNLEIVLDSQTVLCSRADYGAEFLKILIPQLAELTFLDHRNRGAGAPCVGAGMCGNDWHDGPRPGDILDVNKPTEQITVKIELSRSFSLNHETKECNVGMEEKIFTNVRGIEFFHNRYAPLGERNYEDCLN
jgi:hypothetical protein